MINKFEGDYFFLSNFYNCVLSYHGMLFMSSEAAFQAMKTEDMEQRKKFTGSNVTPTQAKHMGRKLKLREDWEDVKDEYMEDIVLTKFTQHSYLANKLLDTGEEQLVEGNTWGDTYWGQVNGVGENKLGQILMRVRDKLRGIDKKFEETCKDIED